MLQPVRRRTWAPSGQTPVQKAWDRHERLSAISIICVSPLEHRLSHYFQLLRTNVETDSLVWFLQQLHHHYGRRVILIWDRYSVHRAAAAFFAQRHPDWFTFEWLPAYAPKLNPSSRAGSTQSMMTYQTSFPTTWTTCMKTFTTPRKTNTAIKSSFDPSLPTPNYPYEKVHLLRKGQ